MDDDVDPENALVSELPPPSYVDFELFLDPTFSPHRFANTLISATNNATDTTLDLSTPLSRVLFDLQEVDTHIHTLTTSSALPLLSHLQTTQGNSLALIDGLAEQLATLKASYARLQKEVIDRWTVVEPIYTCVKNLASTTRLLRGVVRCLLLARQLEIQLAEALGTTATGTSTKVMKKDDPKALVRAAYTVLELRRMYTASGTPGIQTLTITKSLLNNLITPSDRLLKTKAQQSVKEFSVGNVRSASASVLVLHLLGTTGAGSSGSSTSSLLTATVQTYLQSQLTTSLASLSRSLTMLSTLDRTLSEVSTRAANIVALERVLAGIPLPSPTTKEEEEKATLLTPLLHNLDTASLPSHFFRTLAGNLDPRVREIIARGGVNARSLREAREKIRTGLRECVLSGVAAGGGETKGGGMEGLVGIMVGAVGSLGR